MFSKPTGLGRGVGGVYVLVRVRQDRLVVGQTSIHKWNKAAILRSKAVGK